VAQHIRDVYFSEEKVPILYEDNVAWVTQMKEEYIEGNKISIFRRCSFQHDLQQNLYNIDMCYL